MALFRSMRFIIFLLRFIRVYDVDFLCYKVMMHGLMDRSFDSLKDLHDAKLRLYRLKLFQLYLRCYNNGLQA